MIKQLLNQNIPLKGSIDMFLYLSDILGEDGNNGDLSFYGNPSKPGPFTPLRTVVLNTVVLSKVWGKFGNSFLLSLLIDIKNRRI